MFHWKSPSSKNCGENSPLQKPIILTVQRVIHYSDALWYSPLQTPIILTVQRAIHYSDALRYHHAWIAPPDVSQNSSFQRWLLCVVCTSAISVCIILWKMTCFSEPEFSLKSWWLIAVDVHYIITKLSHIAGNKYGI